MIPTVRFTILVDTELPATDMQGNLLLSQERGADRLATAIAALGYEVSVSESPLAAAPPDGWLLYFGADPAEAFDRCGSEREAVRRRLAIIDQDRVTARELMQELAVPFVVTSSSYSSWLRNSVSYAQVVAPPALARNLGIVLPPEDLAEPFVRFSVVGIPLPEGIARSCLAVTRRQGPSSGD
ncbi:MAG: hypothetical protein ACRD2B_06015 [Terriglobia bacterium]